MLYKNKRTKNFIKYVQIYHQKYSPQILFNNHQSDYEESFVLLFIFGSVGTCMGLYGADRRYLL